MITLDTVNRSLEVVLDGAVSSNQLPIVATYVDVTTTAYVPGTNTAETNDTTNVTAVAAPSASMQRQIKFLSIRNADDADATVIVKYNDNSTIREIVKITLSVDDVLIYTDGEGFRAFSGTGEIKTSASGGSGTVGPGTQNEIAYFDTTSTVASLAVTTYPSLTELSYVKGVSSALQTQLGAKLTTPADPGLDIFLGWDEDTNAVKFLTLSDIVTEGSPATGDFALIMGAEGDLRKVDWSAIGGGGGATTALNNLASVAINTSLISDTDNTDDIGSSSIGWRTGYFDTSVITPKIIGGSTTTSDLYLQTTSGAGATGADMHFLVGNNGATEAMTILNSGNVGIGTTNPSAEFTSSWGGGIGLGVVSTDNYVTIGVKSKSSTKYAFFDQTNNAGKSLLFGTYGSGYPSETWFGVSKPSNSFIFTYDTGALAVGTYGNTNLTLGTNNLARVTIQNDGNVGIGTTSPSTRLDIDAGAMEFAEMTAPAAGAANTARLFAQDNGAGKTQLCVIFATGAIQVLATEP